MTIVYNSVTVGGTTWAEGMLKVLQNLKLVSRFLRCSAIGCQAYHVEATVCCKLNSVCMYNTCVFMYVYHKNMNKFMKDI